MDGQNFNNVYEQQQNGQPVYYQQPVQQNGQYYYQQPVYQPQPPQKSNGKAIASLVLSIISLVCIFFSWSLVMGLIGIVCSVIGLVLGIMANKENKSGMATAGIVMSAIGLGLCALSLIACIACVSACNGAATSFYEGFNEGFQDAMRGY